jgi:hypothetical protein
MSLAWSAYRRTPAAAGHEAWQLVLTRSGHAPRVELQASQLPLFGPHRSEIRLVRPRDGAVLCDVGCT